MNAFFRPLLPRLPLPFLSLSGRELISPRETNRSWMNVDERVPVELSGAKEFIAPLLLLLFSKQIRLFLGGGGGVNFLMSERSFFGREE